MATATLFFPGPLLRQSDLPDTARHLYRLLCRGRCEKHTTPDPCAMLCALFAGTQVAVTPVAALRPEGQGCGVGKQPPQVTDPPVAALRLLATQEDPGDATWICADPVCLIADLNGLVLLPLAQEVLDEGALDERLAPVFTHHQLAVRRLSPTRWCLGTREHTAVQTTSLALAAGHDIRTLLPQGKDHRFWRQLLTECQMALHDDRADQTNSSQANSLWFWGAGPASALPDTASQGLCVFADEPLCQALARRTGIACAPLPSTLPTLSQDSTNLFVLGPVDPPTPPHPETLARLEAAWFTPALQQLRSGSLHQLTILDNTHRLVVNRRALWRFWRRKPRY